MSAKKKGICLARLGKSKVQGEGLGRAEQLLKDVEYLFSAKVRPGEKIVASRGRVADL